MSNVIDIRTQRPVVAAPPQPSSHEAIEAMAAIIERARQTGCIDAADHAAFGVYALALMPSGWELRFAEAR